MWHPRGSENSWLPNKSAFVRRAIINQLNREEHQLELEELEREAQKEQIRQRTPDPFPS